MSADDTTEADAPNYENDGAREQLLNQFEERQQQQRKEQVEQATENATTRKQIASEEQPEGSAPIDLRETFEVEFRGHPFEFYELGDAQVKVAELQTEADDEIEEGTSVASFVYETLGDKCVEPWADEEYWRQYDTDAAMGVFEDLVEVGVDVDPEKAEEIEEFRSE